MIQNPPTIETGSSNVTAQGEGEVPALMIAWCAAEPARVGEVALFEDDGSALILGRGEAEGGGRVSFHRQRPGLLERMPALQSPGISREQLRIGVVVGNGGGILEKMLPAFRAFVGGPKKLNGSVIINIAG